VVVVGVVEAYTVGVEQVFVEAMAKTWEEQHQANPVAVVVDETFEDQAMAKTWEEQQQATPEVVAVEETFEEACTVVVEQVFVEAKVKT